MSLVLTDRIRDTTTSTASPFTVSGVAPITYKTFSQVMTSPSDTCLVVVVHQTLDEWEVMYATYSASNQLTRTTTLRSSDSGDAAITFSAGTKDVILVWPGMASVDPTLDKLVMWDAAANNWKWADLASLPTDTGPTTGDYLLVQQAADSISKVDWALIGPAIGGRLSYVSTTSLRFVPFNGNLIKINGTIYQIPTAGIAGLASATSVFVNGTGATTLASNTLYYVYAFVNSGTVTADFRTDGNGHIVSNTAGNEGVEVRCSAGTTRDDTRTLIGLIHTNPASIQYIDTSLNRGVRSWLNDNGDAVGPSGFSTTRSTSSGSDPPTAELNTENRVFQVLWANEQWYGVFTFTVNSGSSATAGTCINLDGGGTTAANQSKTTEIAIPDAARKTGANQCLFTPGEGYHFLCVRAATTGGVTMDWNPQCQLQAFSVRGG